MTVTTAAGTSAGPTAGPTTRRRASLALAAAVLLGGTLAGQFAVGTEATAAVPATVYACNVTGGFGPLTAGYYSGSTAIPSTSQVTAAGKEAQCLLKYRGYDPGTVDGIFGSKSQAAARAFQHDINDLCEAALKEDGSVGPKTWPWLRYPGC
ncbi:peptidoglycan-binding protein [Streptomyces sp. NPDC058464]|uniref:peptidoglycan-binding domain-containing protein n=1 Tax=Streptomyces sp. NPDC058464 TaxID=3346511 RepID=UPI00365A6CF4